MKKVKTLFMCWFLGHEVNDYWDYYYDEDECQRCHKIVCARHDGRGMPVGWRIFWVKENVLRWIKDKNGYCTECRKKRWLPVHFKCYELPF